MKAVTQKGLALQHATEELRGDREIVMAALSQDGWALEYATEVLRGNREIVMKAVTQKGLALQYATEALRGDREIVMAAVSQNGWALKYATEALRGDREIVMKAVTHKWVALQFATEELRGDNEIMEVALRDSDALALKVMLLSGRSCTQLFSRRFDNLTTVLRECAALLGLDPDPVVATGTLVQASRALATATRDTTMPRKQRQKSLKWQKLGRVMWRPVRFEHEKLTSIDFRQLPPFFVFLFALAVVKRLPDMKLVLTKTSTFEKIRISLQESFFPGDSEGA